ncbi:MAG: tyrosine-type recombinase/integrase [Deinococcales bacterium]
MTAATYLSGIRALYQALIWAGLLEVSPAQEVRSPVDPRPRHEKRPALPNEDYKYLLKEVSGRDVQDKRMRVLLRLMGDQGLRISEVVNLALKDIDMRAAMIFIHEGKGGKSRSIPMTRGTEWARVGLRNVNTMPKLMRQQSSSTLVKWSKKSAKDERCTPTPSAYNLISSINKAVFLNVIQGRTFCATAGTRLYRNTATFTVSLKF